eukprot:scaffold79794_cov66-Attheya_sp.AAC.2
MSDARDDDSGQWSSQTRLQLCSFGGNNIGGAGGRRLILEGSVRVGYQLKDANGQYSGCILYLLVARGRAPTQSFQTPSRSIAVKLSWYWNSGLLSAKMASYRRRHRRGASGGPSTADQPKKGQPAWCDTRS